MNAKVIASATAVLLVMTAAACQRATEAQEASGVKPPPNEVWITERQIREAAIETTEAGSHPVDSALTTTGHVVFSDVRISHVFSPVTGRVTSLLAGPGQSVRRGKPLAVIASPDLGTAVSDLEKAEADLAVARRELERQKELYEGHAAAQRDYEASESAYRKARAERDRAAQKSRLLATTANDGTQDYILRAPIDGDVVARNAGLGMEVQGQYSGGSAPELFTIGNLDVVWVLADVYEVDLPKVRLGAPATVNVVSYPDHPFRGRVDLISGTLDPGTRTVKVRCTIDNSGHLLRPEMYASAVIATDTREKLSIPRTAVVRVGEQMVTFVARGPSPNGGQRFERRLIGVDDADAGEYVPVTRGLQPGERVVSSGAIMLSGSAR